MQNRLNSNVTFDKYPCRYVLGPDGSIRSAGVHPPLMAPAKWKGTSPFPTRITGFRSAGVHPPQDRRVGACPQPWGGDKPHRCGLAFDYVRSVDPGQFGLAQDVIARSVSDVAISL